MKTLKWIILVGIFSITINAQTSITATSDIWSQYMGYDGAIFLESPVIHSGITLSWPAGIYAGLWHSVGLDDRSFNSNFGDEIDLYAGWGKQLGAINIDIGTIYIDVYPLNTIPDGDVIFSHLEGNLTSHGLTSFVRWDNASPLVGSKPTAGNFLSVGLRQNFNRSDALQLGHETKLLYDSGAFDFDTGWLAQSLWTVSYHGWQVHARLSYPLSDLSQRDPMIIFGCGHTWHF